MRSRRTAAQLLHRPRRRSPFDVVRHLAGVQAQVRSAAGIALACRTDGLTMDRVNRARIRDRSIVLTWAMRGTLHLIAADDYGWIVPLVLDPQLSNAHRRLRQEGVPSDRSAQGVRWIQRMLERDGPLDRSEIAERLTRRGIPAQGQALAHLLWLAAARGLICHGEERGREQSFVLVRDWLGEPKPMKPEAALIELGARYLRAHGLAQPEDLAFWSGMRLRDAKHAWRELAPRLVETPTDRGMRWALRGRREDAARGALRLLPSFDEYLLGWKDRRVEVASEHWRIVNRGGGWLRPVIIADGRGIGTWTTTRAATGLRLECRPFSRLAPAERAGIAAEMDRLAAFFGASVEFSLGEEGGSTTEESKRRQSSAGGATN